MALTPNQIEVLRWAARNFEDPPPAGVGGDALSEIIDGLIEVGLLVYENAVGSQPIITDDGRAALRGAPCSAP